MSRRTENQPSVEKEPNRLAWISMYNRDGGVVAEPHMEAGPFHWNPLSLPYSRDLEIHPRQAKFFAESLGLPKDWKVQLLPMPRTLQNTPTISSKSRGKVAIASRAKTKTEQQQKFGLVIDHQLKTIILHLNFHSIEDELLDQGIKRQSREFTTLFAQEINSVIQFLRTRLALEIFGSKISKSRHKTITEEKEAQILANETAIFSLPEIMFIVSLMTLFMQLLDHSKKDTPEQIAATILFPIAFRLIVSTLAALYSKYCCYLEQKFRIPSDELIRFYNENTLNAFLTEHVIKHLYLPILASVLPAHPAFIRAVPVPPSAKTH